MNLITEVFRGREGHNTGLNLGLPKFNAAINGIQKKCSYVVAAEKKVGKTAYVDMLWLLNIYLFNPDANVKWIYFSFEIDRINKEAKYASYFMYHDYGIEVSDTYILGKQVDIEGNRIVVTDEHFELIQTIYQNRIIPLFGEYDNEGNLIKEGKIEFIEDRLNPTGIRNYLFNYAEKNGKLLYQEYTTTEEGKQVVKKRISGYQENDPSLYTIIIIDHVRATARERGYSMKENIDKLSEYHVFLRNMFQFTFVLVSHLNRGITDLDRIKYMKDKLYPTSEDLKDSGNLAEDATHIITLFNPSDDKYKLSMHFGRMLGEYAGKYRSIHLVDSRYAFAPQHFATTFDGANLNIKQL